MSVARKRGATMNSKLVSILLNLLFTILFFQNCGQEFRANLADLSSEGFNEIELPSVETSDEEHSTSSLPTSSTSGTGKIYYVSTAGDDENNTGTFSKPFRTVKFAVDKMVAGDTTYVRSGLYREGLIRFSKTGTEQKPIKLLNYPKELPIIDFGVNYDERIVHRFEILSAKGVKEAIGWITLEGFEARNGYNAIKYYNLHNSVIRRNIFHHNVSQGIKGNGSFKVLIDRNIIHSNGDFAACERGELSSNGAGNSTICSQQHGIYIDGQQLTITNNLIYNNLCFAITQNGSSGYSETGHAGQEFAGAENWLIANNVFAYQYYCAAISVWGSRTSNTKIINNIFYENSSSRPNSTPNAISLYASNPARGIEINNNMSYATGLGGTKFISNSYNSYVEGIHYKQSYNIVNTLSPLFINAPAVLLGAPNFQLRTGSPAINSGMPYPLIKTDYNGIARPQGGAYDIGAFEFLAVRN